MRAMNSEQDGQGNNNENQAFSKYQATLVPLIIKDLEEDLTQSGKRSVKDCLRSKILPRPQVKRVLETREATGITKQELQLAQAVLIGSISQLKQRAGLGVSHSDTTDDTHDVTQTSLWSIARLATVSRFVQLLLELIARGRVNQENAHVGSNSSSSNRQQHPVIWQVEESDLKKMIQTLLQCLIGVASTCLAQVKTTTSTATLSQQTKESCQDDNYSQQETDHPYEKDISTCFDPIPIACFIFGTFVRFNHYVRTHPYLLVPLWKGLCELETTAGWKDGRIPSELALDAIKALYEFIKEGVETALDTCSNLIHSAKQSEKQHLEHLVSADTTHQQAFQVKILSFLVSRLSTILHMVQSSKHPELVSCIQEDVWSALVVLRGLGIVVEARMATYVASPSHVSQATTFVKPYIQLATKVDKATLPLLTGETNHNKSHDSIFCLPLMNSFLNSQRWKGNHSRKDHLDLSHQAFVLGKSSLLTRILEDANKGVDAFVAWCESDIDLVLRICRELLLSSLPSSFQTLSMGSSSAIDTLAKSMATIGETIFRCENLAPCIAINNDPGRRRFHHALIRWLLPPQSEFMHPLAAELTASLLHSHILLLCRCQNLEASSPLVSLLIQLCFDRRTVATLRRRLAAIVMRLLHCSNDQLRERVQQLVSDQVSQMERDLRSSLRLSKKRKRAPQDHACRYDTEDIRTLAWVVSSLPSRQKELLERPIQHLNDRSHSDEVTHAAFCAAVKSAAIDQPSEHLAKSFHQVWACQKAKKDARSREAIGLLGSSLFRSWRFECDKLSQGTDASQASWVFCLLPKVCSGDQLLCYKEFQFFAFEAITLLGSIARAIRTDCSREILEELSRSFKFLLSSNSWTIRSCAMSSLVTFAATIPAAHKSILPLCIPSDDARQILQCRLQNVLPSQSNHVVSLRDIHAISLCRALEKPQVLTKLFPEKSCCTIAAGSYLMTMPTQEGRTAIVIFPPGRQSLKDIRYMLAMDENAESPGVCTIHRTTTSADGTLCNLFLTD